MLPSFSRNGIPIPTYSAEEPGDAEPAGIAAKNADLEVTRIKVLRDLYYTSVKGQGPLGSPVSTENETGESISIIEGYHRDPESWSTEGRRRVFPPPKKAKLSRCFDLKKGKHERKINFFRWETTALEVSTAVFGMEKNLSSAIMLIGRAMLIYWPHTLNKPVKYFPNFNRMGFIK